MRELLGYITISFFALLLTACPAAQPPVTEEPPETKPTFPVSEVSGTLLGWSGSEAYITLAAGFSDSSTGDPETDGVQLGSPTYKASVSPGGSFSVTLNAPGTPELTLLACADETIR